MEATVEVSANDFVNVKFEKKSNVHRGVSGSETEKEKGFKKKEVVKDNSELQINEFKDDKGISLILCRCFYRNNLINF